MTITDSVLRSLDPADRAIDPNSPRALADLERILASDPGVPAVAPRKSPRRKISIAVGAVAASTVAALVVPSALGGDKAFATWTATPGGVSASERADAANSCRAMRKSGSPEYAGQLKSAGTAIVEKRGKWSLVVLAGQNGFSALCITDESTRFFKSNVGSIGTAVDADRPNSRGLSATDLGTTSIDGHDLSVAVGTAAADVTSVTYTSPTRGAIKATVSGGHFAFWLPGNDLTNGSKGTPVQVTYRDGTSATVVLSL